MSPCRQAERSTARGQKATALPATAENVAKDVAKDVTKAFSAESTRTTRSRTQSLMAEAIVGRALVFVTERKEPGLPLMISLTAKRSGVSY